LDAVMDNDGPNEREEHGGTDEVVITVPPSNEGID